MSLLNVSIFYMHKIFSFRNKINLIFLFLICLSLLFSAFIFYQYFSRKDVYINVMLKVIPEKWYWGEQAPPNWYVFSVAKGDKEIDGLGKTTAEVTDIIRYDIGGASKLMYVKAKLLVKYQKNTNTYIYKNKPLELNGAVELAVNNTNIAGVVQQIEDHPKTPETRNFMLTVRLYDRHPWFADAIKIDDKYTVEGEEMARVLEKKVDLSIRVNPIMGKVADGTVLPLVLDPLKRDITLKMRIKASYEGEHDWIFRKDQILKVGNELAIPLDNNVNLFGANVLKIEEDATATGQH